MRLYLVRHGIADHPDWTGPDRERPLNDEGIASLRKYGKRLTRWGVEPSLILYSPYVRASQTAEIVAKGIGASSRLQEEGRLAPGFSLEGLRKILELHGDESELMLVGHNPDFEEVAEELVGGGRIDFGKGAICCVDVNETKGARLAGTLQWFATRKMFAKKG